MPGATPHVVPPFHSWPQFGTPQQDAERRDFTINSLFYNINTGAVEDLTGRQGSRRVFVLCARCCRRRCRHSAPAEPRSYVHGWPAAGMLPPSLTCRQSNSSWAGLGCAAAPRPDVPGSASGWQDHVCLCEMSAQGAGRPACWHHPHPAAARRDLHGWCVAAVCFQLGGGGVHVLMAGVARRQAAGWLAGGLVGLQAAQVPPLRAAHAAC